MSKANKRIFGIFFSALLLSTFLFGCSDDENDAVLETISVPEMIAVPAGSFVMGYGDSSSASGPAHSVTLTGYDIGKYEITNDEYASMLNYALSKGYLAGDYTNNITIENRYGDSRELLDLNGDYENKNCQIFFSGGRFLVEAGTGNRPVRYVTWYGAAFYANMLSEYDGLQVYYDLDGWRLNLTGGLGYRLPTEAEWEMAARYPDGRAVPWRAYDPGESEMDMWIALEAQMASGIYANFNGNVGDTTDVTDFSAGASALGIYNLIGNVSEWCQDYYSSYNDEAQADPVNDSSGVYRQRRGGGWLYYANNFYWATYHTDTNYGFVSYCDLGFRVVRSEAALNAIVF